MSDWLVISGIFIFAIIIGIVLPLLYMRSRSYIDSALDSTRRGLLQEANEWLATQGRRINNLEEDLGQERERRVYLEFALEKETQTNIKLSDSLEVLRAQVAKLETDRDRMSTQLNAQQTASDVYRATLVVLLLQFKQNSIRPNINAGLLDVVRKDGKAGKLLEIVEEYLTNGE